MSGQPVYADLQNHDGGGLWQQAGGVTFVIYMVSDVVSAMLLLLSLKIVDDWHFLPAQVIGFSATMGLIVAVVGSLMFIRYNSIKNRWQKGFHTVQQKADAAVVQTLLLPKTTSSPAIATSQTCRQ